MRDNVFGYPAESVIRSLQSIPQGCSWMLLRVVAAPLGRAPEKDELWLAPGETGLVPTEPVPEITEQVLKAAKVEECIPARFGGLFAQVKDAVGDQRVRVVVAAFWGDASGSVCCRLLTPIATRYFLDDIEKVREVLGGPDLLVPQEDEPEELEEPIRNADWTERQVTILYPTTARQVLAYANRWPPLGHLEDAKTRLLSGGFVGMAADVLEMICKAARASGSAQRVDDLKAEVNALASVNVEGASTWLDLWRRWDSLAKARVEIVENNQWKQLVRAVFAAVDLDADRYNMTLAAQHDRRRFGISDHPGEEELVEAEIRFLMTQLFRPALESRMVTVEILQLLGSGRSGALTFLVQPRLRIDPTPEDPTVGVESRIGRVSVVKLDDVGLIAREHSGFVNVVDRYLYSYAARISRVAKAHRFGGLAYASIGGLDDYSTDPGGTSGPISLRDFISAEFRLRKPKAGAQALNQPGDVGALLMALDRCMFADLHQDSRKGTLSFWHYVDVLPPDYRIRGPIGFIARRHASDQPVRFEASFVRREEQGACDGRIVSLGRDSIYLVGNTYVPDSGKAPSGSEDWWRIPECWTCLSEQDRRIGFGRAVVQVQSGAYGMIGTLLGVAKHMRTEVVPSINVVAYGKPEKITEDEGSDTFRALLSREEKQTGESIRDLPWRLLGLLRSEDIEVPARIGSTHGDLNLTNVLVTFLERAGVPHDGTSQIDPRCWLIDYEKTRLDGHTGRDYGQLEIGLRREVLAPTYMDMCRQLTGAADVDREAARSLILAYHWALEEQLARYDTARPEWDELNREFETIALVDAVLPLVRTLDDPCDLTTRLQSVRDHADWGSGYLRCRRLAELSCITPDQAAHLVFAYMSSNAMVRRCYGMLRLLRQLALDYGHDRTELVWAQMLTGIGIFKHHIEDRERLDSLEREVVLLAVLAAANEIKWSLLPGETAKLTRSQREASSHQRGAEAETEPVRIDDDTT